MRFKRRPAGTGTTKPSQLRALPEKAIQKTIVDYLRKRGLQVSVTNSDRTWGKGGGVRQSKVDKGHPDLTAVLPVLIEGDAVGVGLYIEVKTTTGSLKPEQREKLQTLDASGALCMVARDVDDVIMVVEACAFRRYDAETFSMIRRLLRLNLGNRGSKEAREGLAQVRTALRSRSLGSTL